MKRSFALTTVLMICMIATLIMGISAPLKADAAMAQDASPTIVSDLLDYPPGATVTLTGANWQAGESVHIFVNDDAYQSWSLSSDPDPIANDSGAFTFQFQLPTWFVANYSVTATGSSGAIAKTTFTDANIGTYDQCSNDDGDGYGGNPGTCTWINGNLQRNNSTYYEGDATVQRLWLTDLSAGSMHTVTFKYGTTKGGKHSYDYLTTWNWSENWITLNDLCKAPQGNGLINGCTTASQMQYQITDDPNVSNTIEPAGPAGRLMTIAGGTITAISAPQIVTGDYTGDSETAITVSYTVGPNTGSMCQVSTCGVMFWFGAHVAAGADWGIGEGAGSITGSPYHVALDKLDNAAVGQRDNQMQANAVANGTIVIVKDAIPNDAQDFKFNIAKTGASLDFYLDDDNDSTLLNSRTFSVPPGDWTVSELDVPSGWTLTGLTCSLGSGQTYGSTWDITSPTVLVHLKAYDTVTCTYTDVKTTNLTVTKTANTSLTRTYSWKIDKSPDGEYWKFIGDPASTHTYTVSVDKSYTDSAWAVSGDINITNNQTLDAKITGVSDVISPDINATVSCPVTFPYTLAAGGTLKCTYSANLTDATARTNTATVTTDNTNKIQGGSGTASVDFTNAKVTEAGLTSVSVTDTNGTTFGPVSDNTTFPSYTKDFSCPTDLSSYTDGVYNAPDAVNTATIDGTNISDSATVKLHCYAPVPSKTADASFTRTYTWDITKDYDGTYSLNAGETVPHDYLVTVTKTTTDSGFDVSGDITVANPNPKAAMTVSLADSVGGTTATLDCNGTLTVPAGSSATCGYNTTLGSATNGTNTATVTLNSINFTATKDYTFTTNVVGFDAVNVTDTNGQNWGPVSDTTNFPYTGNFSCPRDPALYKDGVYTITNTNTATITESGQSDDATVTVTCHLQNLVVTKTATPSYTRTFDWTIDKNADPLRVYSAGGGESGPVNYTVEVTKDQGTDSGWAVSGTITVHNPNPFDVTGVSISDETPGGTCVVTPDTVDVKAGDDATAEYVCTFDSNPDSGTNTATAEWGVIGGNGTVDYTFGDPTNLVNDSIHVTDTNGYEWDFNASGSEIYSMTFKDPAGACTSHKNTATIDQLGKFDSVTVEDCQGADLVVTKTATPAFTRTWTWTITKEFDGTYSLDAGASTTHGYKVTVDPTSADSDWVVSGTIHVVNPNKWQSITFDASDAVLGGECTVTNGTNVEVAADDSVDLPYSCTFAEQPDYNTDLVNTATVTWDSTVYHTPNGSDTGDATFQFTNPTNEINPVITVDDSNLSNENWSANRTSGEWIYTRDFACSTNQADYTNGTYSYSVPNQATIVETNQSESAKVDVTCHLAALTATKDATATYKQDIKWDLLKTISDDSLSGYAGQNAGTSTWTVTATKTYGDPYAWLVTGKIYIHNPSTIAQTFSVTDVLDDGTNATVTCPDPAVVPASGDVECTYTASPTAGNATKNTATISAAGNTDITATADVAYGSVHAGFETATLEDGLYQYKQDIIQTTVLTWDQAFSCSDSQSSYIDGKYSYDVTNTATLKFGTETLTRDVKVGVDCTLPKLTATKDATATYKQDITWDLQKTVSDNSHSGFAGQDAGTSTWTVTATKTIGDPYDWLVAGTIYIHNPAAITQTFSSVSDVLNDGTTAVVTCPYGNVIPAGGDLVCWYGADPISGTATKNTATISAVGNADITAEADVAYNPVRVGSETAVMEDGLHNYSEELNQTTVETWDQTFSCSSDQSSYTNGSYHYDVENIATLKVGDVTTTKEATVGVDCYAPVVSKTAAGTYDERHEWTVEKTVTPVSQSAFAGDTVSYEWTVVVTEQTFEEKFKVAGEIYVVNPAPMEMTVDLFDELGGTDAMIGICTNGTYADGKLTIPANTTAKCPYTAEPAGHTDTVNNVAATLNGIDFDASATFGWTANIIRGSVSLDDDQNPAFPKTLTDGETFTYAEQYTCSTDKTTYDTTTHKYTFGESNTAVVKDGETTLDSSTASNTINCYVPTISKDASGKYDEVHDWEVFKSVNSASQTAFAGQKVNFSWTVRVDETTHGENYLVTGNIIVTNPNPEDALTVSLSDTLNDDSVATIGPCTGGTWNDPNLTVPHSGTATCNYTVTPKGDLTKFADALPATVGMAQIDFADTTNPIDPAYFEVVYLTGGGTLTGNYLGWSLDTDISMTSENVTGRWANVYSSYENLPADNLGIENPQNLDLVNWIINQKFVGEPASGSPSYYTFGDVQRAIWELVEGTPEPDTKLGTWIPAHVNEIKTAAITNGEGFLPTCGDFVAVILEPIVENNQRREVLTLAQVSYASLSVECAASNKATAVLNGIEFPASADIVWTANPINPTATLDDDQATTFLWPTPITGDGTWSYQDPQGYTCSTNPAAYTNGFYQYDESNKAVLTFKTGYDDATASTAVKCYAPVVSKTASGAYDERHEWNVEKTVDQTTQNAFAGDTVSYKWTVNVTESVFEENFVASGTISVKNPRPDDGNMIVKLTDVLSDGFVPTITGCTGGTWDATNKMVAVPPSTTAICSYTASLTYSDNANAPTDNTVSYEVMHGTTRLKGTASDTVEWTANVIRGSATIDDDQNTVDFPKNITDGDTWAYKDSYTCSTTRTEYGQTSFWYKHPENNTAVVTSGGTSDSASASTEVNCYWPQIDITKTGDELSKITDTVYYDITVSNNTPTDLNLRALSCTISDTKIGYNETVELISGATDENLDIAFPIPDGVSDPFVNTASVTCSPLGSTFSVSDSASFSTNLFQPAVEIIKTGPANATSGDSIEFTYTINNKSSSDSPKLVFGNDGHVYDNVIGDLTADAVAAGCDDLGYNDTCTFKKTWVYTLADPIKPQNFTNIVDVLYHPDGFPNSITAKDDHTVTITPQSQLTDTSFCPLANNQFRLMYHLEVAPNIYRLQASNPGQWYFNAFYYGARGTDFTMTIQVPYPFVTQEGAGNPIQVHDGTTLTSSGCYLPNPSLTGFNITTPAMTPTSSAGNQIITSEDYSTKNLGSYTTVTVSGQVPETGMAYVTIHLDYALKKTGSWKQAGTYTTNPVNGASIADVLNQTGFGSGPVTIHGYEVYTFSRTVGSDTSTTAPSSFNEFKKFAGFMGFVTDKLTGDAKANVKVVIYDPAGKILATVYTDADGYYMYAYKHTAKSATYTVKVPNYGKSVPITVKANGLAAIDFEVP